jgi:hypothetical protein
MGVAKESSFAMSEQPTLSTSALEEPTRTTAARSGIRLPQNIAGSTARGGEQRLRQTLLRLKHRKGMLRLAEGVLLALLGVVALLWGIFVVDWTFDLSRWPRLILELAAVTLGLSWLVARVGPMLVKRESLEELALELEQVHEIDSDLIAALHFKKSAVPGASVKLTDAVIEYVEDFSQGIDPLQTARWSKLAVPLAMVLGLSLSSVAATWVYPDVWQAFSQRLLLTGARYPTRTKLVALYVNGQRWDSAAQTTWEVRCPAENPIVLEATTSGEEPTVADWFVATSGGGPTTSTPLAALTGDEGRDAETIAASAVGSKTSEVLWRGEIAQLPASADAYVRLGDFVSESFRLKVVARPVVDLEWMIATRVRSGEAGAKTTAGSRPAISKSRNLIVRAGSQVSPIVMSLNKPLASGVLRWTEEGRPPLEISLQADGTDKGRWTTPPDQLPRLKQGVQYQLRLIDEDGLAVQPEISGSIRIEADRSPKIVAAVISKLVLPTAKPVLRYGVTDDYGVVAIKARLQLITEKSPGREVEVDVLQPMAVDTANTAVTGEFPLDLSPYGLAPGDELRVTLMAADDRGDASLKWESGSPILLKVTDQSGILAGLLESDQQTAKQLDAIIARELGIGGR